MARTAITATSVSDTSIDLTVAVAAPTALTTGAGNGVKFPYRESDLWFLYNPTAGAITFTIKTAQPPSVAAQTLVVPDKTISVAAASIQVQPARPVFIQNDGQVYVECSAAGKVFVLARQL
jgi:hypothetical protein